MNERPAFPPHCDILLLEDDTLLRKRLAAYLRGQAAEVTEAENLSAARRLLAELRFDYALVDLHLPDGEALELLRAGVFSENTAVVVMTAFGGLRQAVEAMRLGAADYLSKPFEPEELPLVFLRCRQRRTLARQEEHRGREAESAAEQILFGPSLASLHDKLQQILVAERRMQVTPPPVLIEGETGTGKSALARWLHRQGPRNQAAFLSVNCAALPEALAESELFGHERGAFTDAKTARLGLFEAASGGTLFLDDINALPPAIQAKLLAAVEDGTIRRVGGAKPIAVDVRIIAASNRPLAELVAEGAFREDLFHRLNLLHLTLPPLRERQADLPALARHLLRQIARRHRRGNMTVSAVGETRLLGYAWPGNIRELAHELERAVIFAASPQLDFEHLKPSANGRSSDPGVTASALAWRHPNWVMPETGFSLEAVEHALIQEALELTHGNVSAAARRLGVTREYLRYRIDPKA